jgi:ring-1,2-phenylacetyl-CoA epoxidase subunit PaaA
VPDDASLLDYLAKGGKLSSPENAPSRYRAELMRQMASFVDSELAGAAGFADCINKGPSIPERIAASRIVLEKLDHAERVLTIMGEFGANIERYENIHPWAARVGREEDLGVKRQSGDMRLNVFHYPLEGWEDAVVMNVLMGHATIIHLTDLSHSSYQPLATAFHDILPVERRHTELGEEGVVKLMKDGGPGRAKVVTSFDYWRPHAAASFGGASSPRFDLLKKLGLRHETNQALREAWDKKIDQFIAATL